MLIETTTFRLRDGVDVSDFLEADARVQTEFFYQRPGLVRRTTARGADGKWFVVVFWESAANADAARQAAEFDGVVREFRSFGAVETCDTERFETLD